MIFSRLLMIVKLIWARRHSIGNCLGPLYSVLMKHPQTLISRALDFSSGFCLEQVDWQSLVSAVGGHELLEWQAPW